MITNLHQTHDNSVHESELKWVNRHTGLGFHGIKLHLFINQSMILGWMDLIILKSTGRDRSWMGD